MPLFYITENKHRTKEELHWGKQVFWQRVSTLATIGAFVAAIIYAYIAHQQVATMQQQIDTSERPWLGIQGALNVIGRIHADPGGANFSYLLKKPGQSVALGVGSAIWLAGGVQAGFALMDSDHCEAMARAERSAIQLWRQYQKHGGLRPDGVTPTTGSIILPGDTEPSQVAPQSGAPIQQTENVYALFCAVYFDQFDIVHVTQLMFCFTNQFPALRDTPLFCGKGNYAY